MLIRSATQTDRDSWERMRQALWPSPARGHAGEIDRYFAGKLREPLEVLIAFHERGEAIGFIELSIRAYAEGCVSDRVAFVEGWYVEPDRSSTVFQEVPVRGQDYRPANTGLRPPASYASAWPTSKNLSRSAAAEALSR